MHNDQGGAMGSTSREGRRNSNWRRPGYGMQSLLRGFKNAQVLFFFYLRSSVVRRDIQVSFPKDRVTETAEVILFFVVSCDVQEVIGRYILEYSSFVRLQLNCTCACKYPDT